MTGDGALLDVNPDLPPLHPTEGPPMTDRNMGYDLTPPAPAPQLGAGMRHLGRLAAAAEADRSNPPPGVGPHPYDGDPDRHCQHPGCGTPDRNPIHDAGTGAPVYPRPADDPAGRLANQLVHALTEVALLADALDQVTHRFELDTVDSLPAPDWCGAATADGLTAHCGRAEGHPVHRGTPDAVRGQLTAILAAARPGPATLRRVRDGLTRLDNGGRP